MGYILFMMVNIKYKITTIIVSYLQYFKIWYDQQPVLENQKGIRVNCGLDNHNTFMVIGKWKL